VVAVFARSAGTGQGDVVGVQVEVMVVGESVSDLVEHVGWQVEHAAADAALGVEVFFRATGSGEVVSGGAVAHVHVGDDAELSENLQGSVHRRQVDARVSVLDLGTEFHRAGVTVLPSKGFDDRSAGAGDPMLLLPQTLDRLGHGPGDQLIVLQPGGDRLAGFHDGRILANNIVKICHRSAEPHRWLEPTSDSVGGQLAPRVAPGSDCWLPGLRTRDCGGVKTRWCALMVSWIQL